MDECALPPVALKIIEICILEIRANRRERKIKDAEAARDTFEAFAEQYFRYCNESFETLLETSLVAVVFDACIENRLVRFPEAQRRVIYRSRLIDGDSGKPLREELDPPPKLVCFGKYPVPEAYPGIFRTWVAGATDRWRAKVRRKRLEQEHAEFLPESPAPMITADQHKHISVHPVLRPKFEAPDGATWEHLTIRFVDGNTVRILLGEMNKVVTHTDLEMVDRRNGNPTKLWELLGTLADKSGVLSWKSSEASDKQKKNIQRLNAHFKVLFGISGNPIGRYKPGTGWITKFKIEP